MLALCLVLLAASVLVYMTREEMPEMSAKKLTIGVSQTPLSAPFLIAYDLKMFKKHGLDIELLPCFGGVKCAEMMFSGQVDYATASESVVMFSSFKREDFSILASFVESDNDLKLFALRESGIQTLSQLHDKKVGVVKASSSEFFLDAMIMLSQVPNLNVIKTYLSPTEINQALIHGEVDAISIWEPYGYQLQTSNTHPVIDLSIRGIYHLSFNLLSLKSTINKHQPESERLLLVLKEALVWMNEHPLETQKRVAQHLKVPLGQLSWTWDDYVFRLSLSNGLLSNLQIQARWALDSGLVSGGMPDYRRLLDRTMLLQIVNQ
ncbi:ABC transporter substrate-binding protein [Vibrio vulnificus]|nr:ABC transporter substrate-binding protein [Vibrio vulnificus]